MPEGDGLKPNEGDAPANGDASAESAGRYQGPRATDVEPPKADPEKDPGHITRTRFMTGVAIAAGGVMTAAILVPVVGFAVADNFDEEPAQWVDAGPMSDFPEGETSSIAISGPDPEADRRAFVRFRDGDIVCIWNRCTHLGCPVSYSAGGDVYACPCHGGAYNSVGQVTAGPPVRPLDRFDWKVVTADGEDVATRLDPSGLRNVTPTDRLLIGVPYSVNDDLDIFKLKGPGEPVDGVLKNLYPLG